MLLILKNIEFGDTNQWPDSSLKKWLNEDFFTSSNFTSIEMAAVPDTKTEEPKELTNPVSRHYGIGPVCMGKVGIYCDIDRIDEIKEKLVDVKWSGWIIKSAITEREEI